MQVSPSAEPAKKAWEGTSHAKACEFTVLERGQEGAGYSAENFPVFNGESV